MTLAISLHRDVFIPISEFVLKKEPGSGASLSWAVLTSPSVSSNFKIYIQQLEPKILDANGYLTIEHIDGVGDNSSGEACFFKLRQLYEDFSHSVGNPDCK